MPILRFVNNGDYIRRRSYSSRPGEWGHKVLTRIAAIILVFILGIFVGYTWKTAQMKPYVRGQHWSSVLIPRESRK